MSHFPFARLKAKTSELTQAREEDRLKREREEARHAGDFNLPLGELERNGTETDVDTLTTVN